MGASASKPPVAPEGAPVPAAPAAAAPVAAAPAAPGPAAPAPELVEMPEEGTEGAEEVAEEGGVPTVRDVIAKLKEANRMLYQIADAERAAEQAAARGEGEGEEEAAPGFYGGKKAKAKGKGAKKGRKAAQKGGFFLDAQKAIMNTSDLARTGTPEYANPFIPDAKSMPATAFSANNLALSQMPPVLPNDIYTTLMPNLRADQAMNGGAAKKKRAAPKKKGA